MKNHTNIRSARISSASTDENPFAGVIPMLKAKVGKRLVRQFGGRVPGSLIGRALDEAIETATLTGFPHLFFPALAEEKVGLVLAAISEHSHERGALQHAA